MNIKKAVDYYNENRREDVPKMTISKLSKMVFKDMKESTALHTMSMINNGQKYNHMTCTELKRMCNILGVSPNFIVKGVEMKKVDECDLSGLLSVMKYTKRSADEILGL
jgi:hypothetical protein